MLTYKKILWKKSRFNDYWKPIIIPQSTYSKSFSLCIQLHLLPPPLLHLPPPPSLNKGLSPST